LLRCQDHKVKDNTMSVREYCVRKVVTAHPEETVQTAARRIAQCEVGALVVTEGTTPVGIVTDRDLVIRVLAAGDDPQTITLRTVMTPHLVCVSEDASLEEAVALMRTSHIRRLVVVNQARELAGIFTLDDLLELVGEYQETLVRLMCVACKHWQ
jgi:CBS domain-containing protein